MVLVLVLGKVVREGIKVPAVAVIVAVARRTTPRVKNEERQWCRVHGWTETPAESEGKDMLQKRFTLDKWRIEEASACLYKVMTSGLT